MWQCLMAKEISMPINTQLSQSITQATINTGLKYLQSDGRVFYSRVFDYFNDAEPISFSPALVEDKITLSRESDYAVVDSYGNQIAQERVRLLTSMH
jgi:hypothetical protein